MRKIIYSLVVAAITLTGNAQENHNKHCNCETKNVQAVFNDKAKDQTILVRENFSGEFISDPLAFVEQRLGIENLIAPGKEYEVKFGTKKGSLTAVFSEDGKLVETHQKFRNILVPVDVMATIYEQYPGWTMVRNTYTASGKADQVDHEKYRITLKKGAKTKRVNISPKAASTAIAAN